MILSHIEPSDLFMPMSIILLAEIYCLSVKRIKNVFLLSPTQSLHNGENVSFAKNILEMCFEAIWTCEKTRDRCIVKLIIMS